VADLKRLFAPRMNPLITAEQLARRLETATRRVATALYTMWRAYLFDEPELEQVLAIGRGHVARLARDSARLIDELRAGRSQLGRIGDWGRLLERFRALDLDPRREAERAQEAARRQQAEEERRDALVARLLAATGEAAEAVLWEELSAAVARPQLARLVLAGPERAEARQAIQFLVDQGYSRDGSTYREEEYAACQYVADRADPALQALMIGEALWPAPRPPARSDEDEAEEVGEAEEPAPLLPSSHHAWQVVTRVARAGRLDARARPALRRML
jgi:hypothetical protein